jgi:hypothetical protein
MLQAATYLERALIAEHKAEETADEAMQQSYLEIAKSWRALANGAYNEEVLRPNGVNQTPIPCRSTGKTRLDS